jgi:small GTP-binding protein
MKRDIIAGIIFSKFDEKIGPDAVCWTPKDLDPNTRNLASIKAFNLLAGAGQEIPAELELISFPSLGLKGLIKCFELEGADSIESRGKATITLLFNESDDAIFYKYLRMFNPPFSIAARTLYDLERGEPRPDELIGVIKQLARAVADIIEDLSRTELTADIKAAFPTMNEEALVTKGPRVFRFKVIVIGDPEVGKTSSILRFTDNVFRRTYIMSIGVNVTSKVVDLDGTRVDFVIWDIAGQSKFDIARRSFYEGTNGQMLVFDLTRPETFKSIPKWHHDIKQALNRDVKGFIIGNKADRVNEIRVPKDDIDKLCRELNLEYIETSAFTGKNIQLAFTKIGQALVSSEKKRGDRLSLS